MKTVNVMFNSSFKAQKKKWSNNLKVNLKSWGPTRVNFGIQIKMLFQQKDGVIP